MGKFVESILDGVDSFFIWLSTGLKQTCDSYCELETADSPTVLVAYDGSLVSLLRLNGVTALVGGVEFNNMHRGLTESLQTALSRPGHSVQFFFSYDKQGAKTLIEDILAPGVETAKTLGLSLDDLMQERTQYVSQWCARESVFIVLWTHPSSLTKEQYQRAVKDKQRKAKQKKIPPITNAQNVMAAFPELRDTHDSFVRAVNNDLNQLNMSVDLLEVHEALHEIRMTVDPEFTDRHWEPILPGDRIPIRSSQKHRGHISDLLWPPLGRQVMPRDAEQMDLRTVRIGDRDYSSIFIYLFPKEIKQFINLFRRTLPTHVPWRMSYLIDGDGLGSVKFKNMLAGLLVFVSAENRLINDAKNLLMHVDENTDDAVVRLRVTLTTWAPAGDTSLLRIRTSQLAKAVEGWGTVEISEVSGDPFAGITSSMLGVTTQSVAPAAVAPLSEVTYMLPFTRPASPWQTGALLFRSPDGKPWPFQPGSSQQTTWIDLIYARPGSGKSVLANATNLALCLLGGLKRLPRIAIIDIGPSSSGLISLLKEALPPEQRHLVAYHRMRMTADYSINPFDTQIGCRYPTPQDRAFLVNFLTLLATPLGSDKPYDGIGDMAGMVVNELYKNLADDASPTRYTADLEPMLDAILEEIGFSGDEKTTWWEVTDALFTAGFVHEAMTAQRYAVPMMADVTSIVRSSAIEDLYGQITVPTGETLIAAFSRSISSAIREYPILSRVTSFDIGDARVVSLDLDEVAKSGGEAADRQTAVMYMLGRYTLARHYYLTEESISDMPEQYVDYHRQRILEIREDPKRLVYDEFHRTSKAQAVRDQVIIDMREGRKWKVQIALLSQSLDDFDSVMIEFATAIYIMDAGPEQAIQKSSEVFGLSETARVALRTRVHGPREGGSTFLAQYATKGGSNMQLLTLTLGPIELWAFSTTAEDTKLRNGLYQHLGPLEGRQLLARLFPTGSAMKWIERRIERLKEQDGHIEEFDEGSVVDELLESILTEYRNNPKFERIAG